MWEAGLHKYRHQGTGGTAGQKDVGRTGSGTETVFDASLVALVLLIEAEAKPRTMAAFAQPGSHTQVNFCCTRLVLVNCKLGDSGAAEQDCCCLCTFSATFTVDVMKQGTR